MNDNKIDLERLRKIELELLKKTDEVCKKLGVNYFLVGGTLLGAVRHHGFIPWDDDIDIAMMRSDYEKFVKEAQSLYPNYYFLQNFHTDPEFLLSFSKIRDSRTTFIETTSKNLKINHGVYIDVFPIDYYPRNIIIKSIVNAILILINKRLSNGFYFKERPNTIKSKFINYISVVLFPSNNYAKIIREKIHKATRQSNLVINYGGAWGKKEILEYRLLSKFVEMPFEGANYPCPLYYDEYLRHIYGNYIQLPPEEKRVSHHFTEVVDFNRGYIEYIKDKNQSMFLK